MELRVSAKIGIHKRPLKIQFNNQEKVLSNSNNEVVFEFDKTGNYDLYIEQVDEPKLNIFSRIILLLINTLKTMLDLSILNGFGFSNYDGVKPFHLSRAYSVYLSKDVDISLDYCDPSFSKAKKIFTSPTVECKSEKVTLVYNAVNVCVEVINQRRNDLHIVLFAIWFMCFAGISVVAMVSWINLNIIALIICTLILAFFIVGYVISFRKINRTYSEIKEKSEIL
ncbi:MAG: hypothetical protein ACI4HZ_03610 [Ruminococcus sp.]